MIHSRRLNRKTLHPRGRRVDALPECVEVLTPVGVAHDDLPVEHVAARREGQLGEVAAEGLAVARLQEDVLTVDECDAAKTVELDLVDVVIARRGAPCARAPARA